VVIVTWDAVEMLPACLDSLGSQAIEALELVVVDNGSTDGSVELVELSWPAAKIIRLGHNVGFAAAAQRGIDESRGEAVALLNYDVRLGPGYLGRCLEALDRQPELGRVQGVLVRPGGSVVDSAGHTATRGRWVRNRGENQAVGAGPWAPASTFGVTAAAAVYRRAMLDDVAGVSGHVFDSAFFAYLEDVDLDWRANWLGWGAAVVDGAVAEHVRSGSGARTQPELQRHIIKNRLLLLYRNEDRTNILRDLPWIGGQLLARWALTLATEPSALLGIVDFWKIRPRQRAVRDAVKRSRRVDAADARRWFRSSSAGGFSTRTRGPAPRESGG
jgi:GT2 family glycosyltransferase